MKAKLDWCWEPQVDWSGDNPRFITYFELGKVFDRHVRDELGPSGDMDMDEFEDTIRQCAKSACLHVIMDRTRILTDDESLRFYQMLDQYLTVETNPVSTRIFLKQFSVCLNFKSMETLTFQAARFEIKHKM